MLDKKIITDLEDRSDYITAVAQVYFNVVISVLKVITETLRAIV